MELISKEINASETSNRKREKNGEIKGVRNNFDKLKLSKSSDVLFPDQNGKITIGKKGYTQKSKITNKQKRSSTLSVESSSPPMDSIIDLTNLKKIVGKRDAIKNAKEKTNHDVMGKRKSKTKGNMAPVEDTHTEQLHTDHGYANAKTAVNEKKRGKTKKGEIKAVETAYSEEGNKMTENAENAEIEENAPIENIDLNVNVGGNAVRDADGDVKLNPFNINNKSEKDTKQIILELKSTLNIVEKPYEFKKIDGLNEDEIKSLDAWYVANKLKIIPCLFEDKPLNVNLLHSLYSVEPSFKHKKSKIIIYLKFVKRRYERSLKKCTELSKEEKKEMCKNTILNELDNNLDNMKEKAYMKKVITLIKNETSYISLKYYFKILVSSPVDMYDVFVEEDGLGCIKLILQNMAKKKIIKKCTVLLMHILNLLKKFNITLDHLKSTLIGIPINFISRNKEDVKNELDYVTDNEQVRNIAKELIDKWKLIRDKALSENKNADSEGKVVGKGESENMANGAYSGMQQNTEKNGSLNDVEKDNSNDAGSILERKSKSMNDDQKSSLHEADPKFSGIHKAKSVNEVKQDNGDKFYGGDNKKRGDYGGKGSLCSPREDIVNLINVSKGEPNLAAKNTQKKKEGKSGESKNIMLEIIDTLNEEYEKKKKRHLEYKKAKIEGKIKKFSALKNISESSKSENLLTDIANIEKVHFDNVLGKGMMHMNDLSHRPPINNNLSENQNLIKGYNYNMVKSVNKNASIMTGAHPPYDKHNKMNESYTLDASMKNRNMSEFVKEPYNNNSSNSGSLLMHRSEHNINRNYQSQKNVIKNKDLLVDKNVYLNKYSTHDGTNSPNYTYMEEDMYKNRNSSNTIMNSSNANYLRNKRAFSKYAPAASNTHDGSYRGVNNYNMEANETKAPDPISKKIITNENITSFSSRRKIHSSPRNSASLNTYSGTVADPMYDLPFEDNNINSSRKTVKFTNESVSAFTYDISPFQCNTLKEMNKVNNNLVKEDDDPFAYYTSKVNNSSEKDISQMVVQNTVSDDNKKSRITTLGNNTISSSVDIQKSSLVESFNNSFMNSISHNNGLQKEGENNLSYINTANLSENCKDNNILNVMNNNFLNINALNEFNQKYCNEQQGKEVFTLFNMAPNDNTVNLREMLNNALNEIFKSYNNFEHVKENHKVTIKENYYPSKIYEDSEIIKNDLILKFNYNNPEKVSIYLKYNNISNFTGSKNQPIVNNCNNTTNSIGNEFSMLPLPELFTPPNFNQLKLPLIPIIPNLPSAQNIIPPIIFPYNNQMQQSMNNIHMADTTIQMNAPNRKLYRSFDEFINIFDEDIKKILLKNTDLANLLMNKPDVVEKMLKGPQYINEALCSLVEELKNWNKSNLIS
ncbi:conserved Plasmodium protein, unknown function [Plasmodium ovale]|uniref:TFIIS N-terminal domain-containing protein n=1 Tax=Plasmodium ovale TaxID=36330 RepID=A0A1D3U7D1_PLAOA|nr:conserved Plasmodium protein, unknown function [Plasmodium ovale]